MTFGLYDTFANPQGYYPGDPVTNCTHYYHIHEEKQYH